MFIYHLSDDTHWGQNQQQPRKSEVQVQTNSTAHSISIAAKDSGGLEVNGGEVLCLALSTCYCNDIYRAASLRNITIKAVKVEASADFETMGKAGTNFRYLASIEGDAPRDVLDELLRHTDTVAEIQNTPRQGVEISLLPRPIPSENDLKGRF